MAHNIAAVVTELKSQKFALMVQAAAPVIARAHPAPRYLNASKSLSKSISEEQHRGGRLSAFPRLADPSSGPLNGCSSNNSVETIFWKTRAVSITNSK